MMIEFHQLRWVLALLLSLLFATMGSSTVRAERSDFGHSSLAAKSAPRLIGVTEGEAAALARQVQAYPEFNQ